MTRAVLETSDAVPRSSAQVLGSLARSSNAWLLFPGLGLLVTIIGMALTVGGDERATYLFAGGLALLAVSPPLAFRRNRTLSLWSVILIDVTIGYTLRLVYVYLSIPSERLIDHLYLRGRSPGYFLRPNLLAIASFLLISVSFVVVESLNSPNRVGRRRVDVFPRAKVRQMSVVFALVALVSTALAIRGFGGISADALAVKRIDLPSLAGGNESLTTLGELRWLSGLALIGYLLLLITFLARAPRLSTGRRVILLSYLLLVLAVPIYTSARGDALTPIVATAIVFYRSGRRIDWRRIAIVGVAALFLLQGMTALRQGGGFGKLVQSVAPQNLHTLPKSIIVNRSFADFSKTAHVIRMAPDQLPWDNGRSIYVFAFAPIPRSVWPSKPLVNSGPLIGQKVYGLPIRADGSVSAGVPAGAQAELYWGFGPVGLLGGSVLIGALLGYVERRYGRRADGRRQTDLLLYSGLMVLLGDGLLAAGVGYSAMRFLLMAFVVGLVVRFSRTKEEQGATSPLANRSRSGWRPGIGPSAPTLES